MKKKLCLLNVLAISTTMLAGPSFAKTLNFRTVVNNGDKMPNSESNFNAYNQPSVNKGGQVVFRARSKSGKSGGQPTKGIYTRNMSVAGSIVKMRADTSTQIPDPNNNSATLIETPSFPRIDRNSSSYAFRGMSKPVWTYTPEGGEETKIGTTGLYMAPHAKLKTGASQLGVVPEFVYFAVPGESQVLKFDMFPGAPSPDGTKVGFKGNYSVPAPTSEDPEATISKTGVYYRDIKNDDKKGVSPLSTVLVVNSDTVIPNGDGVTKFGSAAPPSTAGNKIVFAGFDNEETPSLGGIYLAKMKPGSGLKTMVSFGGQVPGEPTGTTFNRLNEALSFNGRFIAFWGAWGSETTSKTLVCPTDGNKDLIAYCLAHDNYKVVQIPVNQGFFVADIVSGKMKMIARTTRDNFSDFLYWNYSGHPPGSTETTEDMEPPRWRNSSFIAVDQFTNAYSAAIGVRAAFKGTRTNVYNSEGILNAKVDGIYLAESGRLSLDRHFVVVETKMKGELIDKEVAEMGTSIDPLLVTSLGIERDGLRGPWLTFNASMANGDASVSWAGIYGTKLAPIAH